MPITTFLNSIELDQPTGDTALDECLNNARNLTGLNYQIVTMVKRSWHSIATGKTPKIYSLYVEVGGVLPYQHILTGDVMAYLQGVVDSYEVMRKKLAKSNQVLRDNCRLREAVILARDTFERYAALHREKGTADGNAKALSNLELAKKVNSALLPDEE